MADNYWKTVMMFAVEEFEARMRDNLKFYMDSFLELVDLLPPADRIAAYEQVNWAELAQVDPETAAKWSQDYLELRRQKVRENGRGELGSPPAYAAPAG